MAYKNGISFDSENHDSFKEIIDFFEKNVSLQEKKMEFIEKFMSQYGINFVPVYSVIGSVASQEFIKVIGRDQEPGSGWFCYDSLEGYGKFEILN